MNNNCMSNHKQRSKINAISVKKIIQIVTGVQVTIENVLPEVGKVFPRSRRPREIFYEPRAKHFQWWSMTLVTVCFVIPHNQKKKILTIIILTKSCDDLNVGRSMLPTRATLKCQCCPRGQHCIFVNVTWRDVDQSRARILRWSITKI